MKKRFLGIICLLYSGIITYVLIFDKLKNFLAPGIQIYIKLSLFPLFIIGLVIIFNNKINYKFKISDLILILPLVFVIIAGDGRLTSSFASKRITNFNVKNREDINENPKEIVDIYEEEIIKFDSSDNLNPYFDIIDANYVELSHYITSAPGASKFLGKSIKVRGFALKDIGFMSQDYFAIGKYEISCCAADAEFTGFVVRYDTNKITNDKWYEVDGVLAKGKDKDGYLIMYIKVLNIKEISSKTEEQYVYPCYAYDDGTCEAISKYDLTD